MLSAITNKVIALKSIHKISIGYLNKLTASESDSMKFGKYLTKKKKNLRLQSQVCHNNNIYQYVEIILENFVLILTQNTSISRRLPILSSWYICIYLSS